MQYIMKSLIERQRQNLTPDFALLGIGAEEVREKLQRLADFEIAHGKYVSYPGQFNSMGFGAYADFMDAMIIDAEELASLCPNIPLQGILTKLGKSGSPQYIFERPWMETLNALWTEENLETLKLMAIAKLFDETRPYRDPSAADAFLTAEKGGRETVTDPITFAYTACDSLDTFSQVLAKLYVDQCLGEQAVERITVLAQDLIDCYKELVSQTEWLEESRERVLEKLDHMQLNILVPKDGYFDYGALELTPSEDGGTLLGNYLKLKQYRYDRESERVGQSASVSTTWYTYSPTTMNAFANPNDNTINILPGFVIPPNYTDDMDDSSMYSLMGFTIAHEISHGFDNMGAQFGAYGLSGAIFVGDDVEDFSARVARLAGYYDSIEIIDDIRVDGSNVVGEAASDLSGLQAVLLLAGKTEDFDYGEFFEKLAQGWAQVISKADVAYYLSDTHPLNNQRINVNAQMMEETYEAFDIREGDGMYLAPEDRIVIWGARAA